MSQITCACKQTLLRLKYQLLSDTQAQKITWYRTLENTKNVEKISKVLNIYNNIHYLFALFLSLRASLRRLLLPLNSGQQDKII